MGTDKRYCLEKFTSYDPRTKLETWRQTKYCSDSISALMNFYAEDMRIIDTHTGQEHSRKVNLDDWI